MDGFYIQRFGCNAHSHCYEWCDGRAGGRGLEHKSGDLAKLRWVSVKAEYRRYSIEKLLMKHVTEWVRTELLDRVDPMPTQ